MYKTEQIKRLRRNSDSCLQSSWKSRENESQEILLLQILESDYCRCMWGEVDLQSHRLREFRIPIKG